MPEHLERSSRWLPVKQKPLKGKQIKAGSQCVVLSIKECERYKKKLEIHKFNYAMLLLTQTIVGSYNTIIIWS